MSSFAKQTRFSALAFHRPVIISGTVKAEAFSQENLPSFAWIGNFSAFVRLVISKINSVTAAMSLHLSISAS